VRAPALLQLRFQHGDVPVEPFRPATVAALRGVIAFGPQKPQLAQALPHALAIVPGIA
jgi:hypothetical protein